MAGGLSSQNQKVPSARFFRAMLGANPAAFLHLAGGKPARFSDACLRAFRAARDVPPRSAYEIPTIGLGQILGERRPRVELTVAPYEDGTLPTHELLTLLAILVDEQPAEVLEIGTFMGHTTAQMAGAVPNVTVHTVDLPLDFQPSDPRGLPKDDFHLVSRREVGREFKSLSVARRIQQHFADTAEWNFNDAGHPTFFFIDGSHTYEYAKHDSEGCLSLCRAGSVILWHDCDPYHPGVERLIFEWRGLGRDVRRIDGTTLAYWKMF